MYNIWKSQGLIKKVELCWVIRKKSCRISMSLGYNGVLSLLKPHIWAISLTWANAPTVAKFISPPRICWSMTPEKVRIVRLLTSASVLHLQ